MGEVGTHALTRAAKLLNAGELTFRRSVSGAARGPLCGMGVCRECAGAGGCGDAALACMNTEVADAGLPAHIACTLLVIGAGPAGLTAALAAAEHMDGQEICVVDENPRAGGQIWRNLTHPRAAAAVAELLARGVRLLSGAAVAAAQPGRVLVARGTCSGIVECTRIILATGAHELFLPFTDWTLPGVVGAGGLQALIKQGLDVRGKRIAVLGSGPLLLAAADAAVQAGADVRLIGEQADAGAMRRFGLAAVLQGKLGQGLAMSYRLREVERRYGVWPVRAIGTQSLEAIALSDGSTEATIACDFAAVGFGLVPQARAAQLIGCAMRGRAVAVDAQMRTSIARVYAAGECTGVGGVDKSIDEGRLAGLAAVDRVRRQDVARAQRHSVFARRLAECFELRDELRTMAAPDAILCRCEDVTVGAALEHACWRSTKLQTRCGMGPCQGRVCGPAYEALTGRAVRDGRTPLVPVMVGALGQLE